MVKLNLQAILGSPVDIELLLNSSFLEETPLRQATKLYVLDAWFTNDRRLLSRLSENASFEVIPSALLIDFDILSDEKLSFLAAKAIFEKLPMSWFLTGLAAYLYELPIATMHYKLYSAWKLVNVKVLDIKELIKRLT
ncbi:MAG: hypothetical protein DRJ33_01660 [Candidatus Methanomethylicota archaeon]|uniref:Uncharacterized protein n=1 Tax=Thermoproteota archaeon TaxID=2056631 RepID=A0A497F160_9CREN|nr:MAG: hypothetical protein DRJ33_01660 [Candidatus Verstraetearchaeota archaeon]